MNRTVPRFALATVWLALTGLVSAAPAPAAIGQTYTRLCDAIKRDDLEAVTAIVEATPGIEKVTDETTGAAVRFGWTPLHFLTCNTGNRNGLKIAELLLQHGANPNAKDTEGNTPLHFAGHRTPNARQKLDAEVYLGIIKILLAHRADVTSRNTMGLTPLHLWTIRRADAAAIELLLDQKADVNAVATFAGWTPLHGAASEGRNDVVDLLLRKGAKPSLQLKDKAGRTPRDAALAGGKPDTAALLK